MLSAPLDLRSTSRTPHSLDSPPPRRGERTPLRCLTLPRRSHLPSPTRCSITAAPRSDDDGAAATNFLNWCRCAAGSNARTPRLPRPAPWPHGRRHKRPALTRGGMARPRALASRPLPHAPCPTPPTHRRHERPVLPRGRRHRVRPAPRRERADATSAPHCPTAILGAGVTTVATCALPHAADARAILDASSVGGAASGLPHRRAGELRPGHHGHTWASSAPATTTMRGRAPPCGNYDSARTISPRPRS